MPGIKRARPESDEATNMTGNQKRKGDGQTPFQKKQKIGAPGKQHPKYQPKKFSLNPLKDKIRDLRRQLSRVGEEMPANIRVNKERELASKEHELWVAQGERLKQDLIPKYHKARFFERQKASRFLKKAVRNLNENSDPAAQKELEDQKHIAEVDLHYTLYYPLIRPYTSLYTSRARSNSEKDQDGATKVGGETVRVGGDETMWKEVETRTSQGTSALEALRNGLEWREERDVEKSITPAAGSAAADSVSKKTKAPTTKKTSGPAKDNKAKKQGEVVEEDEDSDGGFFE
ncbi:uncharacterized protein J3D65DRAFT_671359 [Phyllosticta citribraziliensis]|uniref:rRNA-processing protein EFG1 n=1 Tax=Phyllosticta citribraziliensis TaxID=989973 RepID=A0ABR1LA86_9PEZI